MDTPSDAIAELRDLGSHPLLRCFPSGAVVIFDQELRYLAAGGLGLADVGLSREMLEGRTIFEVFPPETAAAIAPAYQRAIAGEESLMPVPYEGRIYVQRLAPLRDEAGNVIAGMGYTQDITRHAEAEHALRESESLLRSAFQHAPIGKALVQLNGTFLQVNPALSRILGYSAAELIERTVADVTHPQDVAADLAAVRRLLRGEAESYTLDKRYLTAAGTTVWASTSVSLVRDDTGRPQHYLAQVQDITERRQREQELALERRRLRDAQQVGRVGWFEFDVDTDTITWSDTLFELYGLDRESFGGDYAAALQCVDPDDRAEIDAATLACVADGTPMRTRYRVTRPRDGLLRWFDARGEAIREDGRIVRVAGAVIDVTDAVAAERILEFATLHDNLTGLANRMLLLDRLDEALIRAGSAGREVAVLFCDLDGFKKVNDTAGHSAGDAALRMTALRLEEAVGTDGLVARVGGDEFVVIVEPATRGGADVGNPSGDGDTADTAGANGERGEAPSVDDDRARAHAIAQRIADVLRNPLLIEGVEHVVSASIGITYASRPPGAAVTADKVLQDADTAMYRAKGSGKDRIETFEHGMRSDLVERHRVEQLLRRAIAAGAADAAAAPGMTAVPVQRSGTPHLTAVYQPVFDSHTRTLVGFEALARLDDGEGNDVPPDVFIPVAEDTRLIHQLGRIIRRLACGQLATWRAAYGNLPRLTMAVNVSAIEARDAGLRADVSTVLRDAGLDPQDLILELTETAMLEAAHSTLTTLSGLHGDGVGIAIDDFGTGYASLRYLATLPISAIKVDRSFTAGLPADDISRKIVNAIAGLASDLDLGCVVEGVETGDQLAALPAGVHLQGWLLGRPAPAAAFDLPALTGVPVDTGPVIAMGLSATSPPMPSR